MKFIVAIIQPFKLDVVREGLSELGVEGLTASEVRGFGRQKGHREVYRGSEYTINYVPKVKIEIAVGDDIAERVVETVQNVAQTGKIGDGKIFVFELSEAIRVRTGETGEVRSNLPMNVGGARSGATSGGIVANRWRIWTRFSPCHPIKS